MHYFLNILIIIYQNIDSISEKYTDFSSFYAYYKKNSKYKILTYRDKKKVIFGQINGIPDYPK